MLYRICSIFVYCKYILDIEYYIMYCICYTYMLYTVCFILRPILCFMTLYFTICCSTLLYYIALYVVIRYSVVSHSLIWFLLYYTLLRYLGHSICYILSYSLWHVWSWLDLSTPLGAAQGGWWFQGFPTIGGGKIGVPFLESRGYFWDIPPLSVTVE